MMITKNLLCGTAVGAAVRLREAWGPADLADPGFATRRGLLHVGFIAPTSKTDRGTALPAAAAAVTI